MLLSKDEALSFLPLQRREKEEGELVSGGSPGGPPVPKEKDLDSEPRVGTRCFRRVVISSASRSQPRVGESHKGQVGPEEASLGPGVAVLKGPGSCQYQEGYFCASVYPSTPCGLREVQGLL